MDEYNEIRLFRKSTRSILSIKFADVGVNWLMSDEAIFAHCRAFYPDWEPYSMDLGKRCRVFVNY